MEQLIRLYSDYSGENAARIQQIPGGGSNREYYRITAQDGSTLIGAVGLNLDENRAFCYLARHFEESHLPMPRILAVSNDGFRYLQTDLGSKSLFQALESGRNAGGHYSAEEKELLRRTIYQLPDIQIKGQVGLDFDKCYPQPQFDVTNVMFDLNYFKYCFLKTTGVEFHELKLEDNFREMADDLANETLKGFMYRDFQARNVMMDADNKPTFIDFQGGRLGPVQYDLVSFLWQASALYPDSLREELINTYISSLRQYVDIDAAAFRSSLPRWVLFRLLQVLGAYGFRGYFERKKHFLDSITPALNNLGILLQDLDSCPYPYLRQVLSEMLEKRKECSVNTVRDANDNTERLQKNKSLKASVSKFDAQGALVVRVFSFSYKKGIPMDSTGNGGGYVFDCRSTHNPGRYEPYKRITGLDPEVIRFLEDDGEILEFLKSVYKLADAHVERYIKRGFTDLMFCFGCTGGQHRSVYSAQHLAEHLHEKYRIKVILTHREQNIHQILE